MKKYRSKWAEAKAGMFFVSILLGGLIAAAVFLFMGVEWVRRSPDKAAFFVFCGVGLSLAWRALKARPASPAVDSTSGEAEGGKGFRRISVGTDAAFILVFETAALPPDFDAEPQKQPAVLKRLHKEGRVFFQDTGSDGSFLLHVYVDRPVPPELKPYMRKPKVIERFEVRSGRMYAVGGECVFSRDEAFKEHAHMGGSFDVPPGTYRVEFLSTEYPDRLLEKEHERSVSPRAFQLYQRHGYSMALAALCVLAGLVSLLFLSWTAWAVAVVPLMVVSVAVPSLIGRSALFQEARQAWSRIEERYPSLVMEFRKAER